jgi:hypothetical protein
MESHQEDVKNLKYLIGNLNSMIENWEKNKKDEEDKLKKMLAEGNREVERCRRAGYSEEQMRNAIAVNITDPKAIYEEHIAECQQHIDELVPERQDYLRQLKELTGSEDIGIGGKASEFAAGDGGKQKLVGCLIWIVIIVVILKACGKI